MYQEVLRGIEGVGIFPAISLVVFVVVFALVIVHAARLDGAGIRHMAALPLEEDSRGVAPRTPLHTHSLAASPARSVRVARSRSSLADQEESR